MSEESEEYNPYCKVCTGCGEDGCCSALICEMSPEGEYCETYLKDLELSHRCFKEIWDRFSDDERVDKIIGEIFDKNYDIVYKDENKG